MEAPLLETPKIITPVVVIDCDEPQGLITRKVKPLVFTAENLEKLYKSFSKFPTIFNKEYLSFVDFMSMFFEIDPETGKIEGKGIFFVVDDFVGVFYITNISWPYDALVHYSFFDRRHKGRVPLVRAMLKYVMSTWGFYRLSVEIPNYVNFGVRRFTEECGFALEGKRRRCVDYKGDRFDVNLYGILDRDIK